MNDFIDKDKRASHLSDDALEDVSGGNRRPSPGFGKGPSIVKYTCNNCTKVYSAGKPAQCECGCKSFTVGS